MPSTTTIVVNVLYLLFVIQIIDQKALVTSDSISNQQNLNYPVVYSLAQDCLPQQDQNLTTCSSKVWLAAHKKRWYHYLTYKSYMPNIHLCLKYCLETPACVVVSRNYWKPNNCLLYSKDATPDIDSNFMSYELNCCELKQNEAPNLIRSHLPILFKSTFCVAPKDNSMTCKHKALQHIENSDLTNLEYKKIPLKNPTDCLNECLNDENCDAVKSQYDSDMDKWCFNYKNNGKSTTKQPANKYQRNIFQIICCQLNDSVFEVKSSFGDLPMVYKPKEFCKTVSSTNVKKCDGKIWHVEDEVSFNGHFKEETLTSLEAAMNYCGSNEKCQALSIDWIGSKCFYFYANEYTQNYRQYHWTSYTLTCCNNKALVSSYNADQSFVHVNFTDYPIISNPTHECVANPQENNSQILETCSAKAWIFVDNLSLKGGSKQLAKGNDYYCFQHCLKTSQCSAVTIEKSQENHCWIHIDKNFVYETDKQKYKSYFLTCCELKNEIKMVAKRNSNGNQNEKKMSSLAFSTINCKYNVVVGNVFYAIMAIILFICS